MSRLSKSVKKLSKEQELKPDQIVTNYMGGDSYKLDPLETLKIISASSIFGEAAYYRKSGVKDLIYQTSDLIDDALFKTSEGYTTTEIFEKAIDDALSYDFEETLKWALTLRNTFNMRLNPQIIMVRAAIHSDREKWTSSHPGEFAEYQNCVIRRADEPMSQLAYYLYINDGKKNKMPSILKRTISEKLSSLSRYHINKYKNAEIGMINAVRLVHAQSPVINELMRNGKVFVLEEKQTWEQKRSAGMSWKEILETTKIGHMALLRNLKNIFTEIDDPVKCREILIQLKEGVKNGKQFPYRYKSAYKVIQNTLGCNHEALILDTLEECMDIAIDNLPKLKGTTVCLSDNSGSAWGTITTEYGTTTIAEIDNLSSVIATKCSDEGYVVKFGDKYRMFPISKRNGCLVQSKSINEYKGFDVGLSTEGGIWKYFRDAINSKTHIDNLFIFSDCQAGTGGLYGTYSDKIEYTEKYGISRAHMEYINVYALIREYRRKVNSKINVFCIQTAGYNNVLIPQMSYRCAILTGWTGKEISFAAEYIRQWDEIESRRNINHKSA